MIKIKITYDITDNENVMELIKVIKRVIDIKKSRPYPDKTRKCFSIWGEKKENI